jgi:hypothetical protein
MSAALPIHRRFVRMFKPQFAPLVESGAKLQTVRPTPKRMPRFGDVISLRAWSGKPYRSKQRVLREATIINVQPIVISDGAVDLDGLSLRVSEIIQFAQADGFEGASAMLDWFRATHGLPFVGIVITWSLVEPSHQDPFSSMNPYNAPHLDV